MQESYLIEEDSQAQGIKEGNHPQALTQYNKLAWLVTLTASLFFFYTFIQMNLFNTINTELRSTFNLNAEELGTLFSMFFYANALFLFPAGVLIDRYSTKKILLCAVSLSTLGTFMFAYANVYWLAALGRFLVGAAAAFCFLSCIRIASRWFPPKRMALVTGFVVTMAMLGGLVAQTPFIYLIQFLGDWRQALIVDAWLGVVILLAIFFIVRDRPPGSESSKQKDQQQLNSLGLWSSIKLAALNPQNWYGGLYTAFTNLPVFILGGLWGVRYLTDVHHHTAVQAANATTVFFVGVIFGCIAYGWISDYMGRRVLPMIAGAILSIAVVLVIMYVPNLPVWAFSILFFLMGFVTSSQVLSYPTIAELNPPYLTSTALSIDSVCIMSSGFIFPPFFGWLMEYNHQANSAYAFNHAMLVLPIAFVAALIICFFMRETFCRAQV